MCPTAASRAAPKAPRACARGSNPHGFTSTTPGSSARELCLRQRGRVLAGLRDERLRHPRATRARASTSRRSSRGSIHSTVRTRRPPRQRRGPFPARRARRPSLELRDASRESVSDLATDLRSVRPPPPTRSMSRQMSVEPRRVQVDDSHIMSSEPRDGRTNIVERDRAHVAEILRDDDVGARPLRSALRRSRRSRGRP